MFWHKRKDVFLCKFCRIYKKFRCFFSIPVSASIFCPYLYFKCSLKDIFFNITFSVRFLRLSCISAICLDNNCLSSCQFNCLLMIKNHRQIELRLESRLILFYFVVTFRFEMSNRLFLNK